MKLLNGVGNIKNNDKSYVKKANALGLALLILLCFQIIPIFAKETDIDFEKTKATLRKISDFHYEQVINVYFKGEEFLIKEDREFCLLENYVLYLRSEFEKGNFSKYFHPYKVKRSKVKPIIHLYVTLQPNVEYVLEIKRNILQYENGRIVKGGSAEGIKLDEKYFKFVQPPPIFDIDISPGDKKDNLIFDLEFGKDWFPKENCAIGISLNGKFALEKESSFNTITSNLKIKRNFCKDGYLPIFFDLKLENTQDFALTNIVGGTGLEILIPVPNFGLTKTQFSPFPVAKIGYEYARKTRKEKTEKIYDMQRVTGNLIWKIPIQNKFVLDNRFALNLNVRERNSHFLRENSFNYRVTKDISIMLMKLIEGESPPSFKYQRNILTGFSLGF